MAVITVHELMAEAAFSLRPEGASPVGRQLKSQTLRFDCTLDSRLRVTLNAMPSFGSLKRFFFEGVAYSSVVKITIPVTGRLWLFL